MDKENLSGVKEQVKGVIDLTVGRLTGNEDLELRGQVEITNGSNKKDSTDFKDNVDRGADDPDNPSSE
jgi:uncharacterized protein YjbJ (UPF0337 family)